MNSSKQRFTSTSTLHMVAICFLLNVAWQNTELLAGQTEQVAAPDSILDIFHEFDNNLLHSFTINYGLNHAVAMAGTQQLAHQGVDWKIYRFSHKHEALMYMGIPGVILGGVLPVAIPYYLYRDGKNKGDSKQQWTALALGQSALLGASISSAYKSVTGRKAPEPFVEAEEEDFSRDFKWGFLERGAFDGWPSGHTTVAFAMATTYSDLYPNNSKVRWATFSYATFIGLSVSLNIHWFSDAFAGALMGYAVGKSVARSFRKKIYPSLYNKNLQFSIFPVKSGLGIFVRF